jgi:hypothetical protein
MASLFRLRRFTSAEAFRRSYTASGIFFKVRVVGMRVLHRLGTIMVPTTTLVNAALARRARLGGDLDNPILTRVACDAAGGRRTGLTPFA